MGIGGRFRLWNLLIKLLGCKEFREANRKGAERTHAPRLVARRRVEHRTVNGMLVYLTELTVRVSPASVPSTVTVLPANALSLLELETL